MCFFLSSDYLWPLIHGLYIIAIAICINFFVIISIMGHLSHR